MAPTRIRTQTVEVRPLHPFFTYGLNLIGQDVMGERDRERDTNLSSQCSLLHTSPSAVAHLLYLQTRVNGVALLQLSKERDVEMGQYRFTSIQPCLRTYSSFVVHSSPSVTINYLIDPTCFHMFCSKMFIYVVTYITIEAMN